MFNEEIAAQGLLFDRQIQDIKEEGNKRAREA